MNNIRLNIVLLFLSSIVLTTSCRDDSEFLSSYYDNMLNADSTYAGQFKTFWTFMDCNYPIWDYEESFGINWDKVYEEYLPQFEEFDKRNAEVNKDELLSLWHRVVDPLHDGHMVMTVYYPNQYDTVFGRRKFVDNIFPQNNRLKSRLDYVADTRKASSIGYYLNQILEIHPSDYLVPLFDDWHKYDYFYCRFVDNIIYILPQNISYNYFDGKHEYLEDFWKEWFNLVQQLHKTAKLKGAIIDLRWFNGGDNHNFHYLLGVLQAVNPTDGYHRCGWFRHKTGIGRYDYSPKTPQLYITDSRYQLNVVNEPIIVLSNCYTASLGEMVCLAAKQLGNCKVIGTSTFGAFNPLNSMEINGVEIKNNCVLGKGGVSSLYVRVPNGAFFTDDDEILEGKGVTPDIEVQLDVEEYNSTGRDTQLERALEYIRTGK